MNIVVQPSVHDLVADARATRVLVTCGASEQPHAIVGPLLDVDAEGRVLYLEPLEASRTQRDLVGSLWFDLPVALVFVRGDGTTWRVGGRVRKSHIAGPLYRSYYERLRRDDPASDLAAVWEIEPLETSDETPATLRRRQAAERPFFTHLDRIARPNRDGRPL